MKAALAEAKVKWAELETAQLNYLIKFVLPDANATTNFDVNSWYKKEAHDDWVKSVETILGQIEVATASTAPVVLSPAQRPAKLFAQVAI